MPLGRHAVCLMVHTNPERQQCCCCSCCCCWGRGGGGGGGGGGGEACVVILRHPLTASGGRHTYNISFHPDYMTSSEYQISSHHITTPPSLTTTVGFPHPQQPGHVIVVLHRTRGHEPDVPVLLAWKPPAHRLGVVVGLSSNMVRQHQARSITPHGTARHGTARHGTARHHRSQKTTLNGGSERGTAEPRPHKHTHRNKKQRYSPR